MQRHVRRDRARARRQGDERAGARLRVLPDRSARADRVRGTDDPVRAAVGQNGRFPVPSYFDDREPQLAFSAIGLDNVLTNPLHMALVAAAIANDGAMMQPRLIAERARPDRQGRARVRPGAVRPADQRRERAGAARDDARGHRRAAPARARSRGFPIAVAGKTGTATNGEDRPPNAWFTAFAPAGPGTGPRIAVAVIVLDGGDLGERGDRRSGGRADRPRGDRCVPVGRTMESQRREGNVTR